MALSVAAPTVLTMDKMRTIGVILAALELAPAEPSDVTAVLLSAADRRVLLGDDDGPSVDDLSDVSGAHVRETTPLARYLADHIDQGRVEHWATVVQRGVSEGRYRPVPVTDPDYPRRLREEWDAPPLLFCSLRAHGQQNATSTACRRSWARLGESIGAGSSLAIVGSRETSDQVVKSTEQVASELSATGTAIVSGLAAGVDAAAHRGALTARGYTVAVMGTGIDLVFPESNRGLAAEIRRGGTLVSQFAPPAPRTRTSFLMRNHVIAALSDASLIMDGDERSGSRHEVEQALGYGRLVFAWAPSLGHRRWVLDLVQAGRLRLVESAGEIRQHLGGSESEGRSKRAGSDRDPGSFRRAGPGAGDATDGRPGHVHALRHVDSRR